jgi:hypothetical protein
LDIEESDAANQEREKNTAFRQRTFSYQTLLTLTLVQTTKDILEWLYPGSFAERHQYLVTQRVENTGQWFIEDPKFNEWVGGSDHQLLDCPGIGTFHFQSC